MQKHLFLALVLITTHAAVYFRLSTNENFFKLNVGDSIISTLGLFKATLLQNQCLLSIQNFVNNNYVKVGNYSSSNVTGNCKSLTIQNGQIVTESNFTYMYVGTGYNISTILTIDDVGIIRLIGTYMLPDYQNQVSDQLSITSFQKNNTFIFPVTKIALSYIDPLPTVLNKNNWQFSTSYGQLDISQYDNPGIFAFYSYNNLKVNNSQIQDFLGYTFPNSIFGNITYTPRCLQPRIYLDFKPPYVLVLDPYWPKATVYEQGRYKIIEVSYNSVYEAHSWQEDRRLFTRNQPSVCPPYTFEFNGTCGTTCPFPYYYQVRGDKGYCVLTCQQYTPKNDTSRVCSCHLDSQKPAVSSQTIQPCPANSNSYPYGCYCTQQGQYFDRLITLSCVTTCPQSTYANNGLCMLCPAQCQTCQIDKLYRAYLQCKTCKQNFSLYGGECHRTCSPGLGFSIINKKCQACSDSNCLNCSTDVNVCTRCNALFAVSNGACVQACSSGTKVAYYEKMNSICLPLDASCPVAFATYYKNQPILKCDNCSDGLVRHLNKCVEKCPTGYILNENNYCICSAPGSLTISDKCLVLPACPLLMGWDTLSSSCLSCPFGCTTCYNLACTSCNPGYFLYISPQAIICRKQSPLFPCDQQYSWNNGACVLIAYNDPNYNLAKCLNSVDNCMACYRNSFTDCSICKKGFYNVNNTCISSCPNGTIPYQGLSCIVPQIVNCSIPYFQVQYMRVVLNLDRISSQPYKFYTTDGKEAANDPVGYIPYYQNMTVRKTDGLFRDTEFYYPSWTCLKCNNGFGLSSNFSQCLPCPEPCLTCYMASNVSCLSVKKIDPQPVICAHYIDFNTRECIKNCSLKNVIPYVVNGILYCYPVQSAPTKTFSIIDSSAFITSNGSTQVFFVLDHTLDPSQVANLKIISQQSARKVSADGLLTANLNQSINYVAINDTGYLYYFQSNTSKTLFILDASGSLIKTATTNNVALSNPSYGVQSGKGYAAFRKTWLAYIGYIMGIVLICLHVVYIGNDLLYKVDNTLILAQSIYFFSFVKLLAGKLLSQFYYGWIFAHFGFFPNFFIDTIPPNYVELAAPNSYKLNSVDSNIIRNSGWAFSLLLVFFVCYGVITFCCWILSNVFHKKDAWHPRIAINSLIAFVQFVSYTIFFWAVANLQYIGNSDAIDDSFYKTSRTVSICFMVLIVVYTIMRWFFNRLGGLYMSKRILIATILAVSYEDYKMIAPLVILEVVFLVFRYIIQSPDKSLFMFMMILESLLHIATYLLLFLVLDAGINTIIISVIIFILFVILSYGLTHLYLQSQNEWQLQQKDEDSQNSIIKAEVDRRVSKVSME